MISTPCSPFWESKRILISWTDKAYSEGCDWPSFVVVTETADGLFLRGCDAPDGTKHNGSHCFAKHAEIRDLWEWISEANAKGEAPPRQVKHNLPKTDE